MEFLIGLGVFFMIGGIALLLLAPRGAIQEEMIQRRLGALTVNAAVAASGPRLHAAEDRTAWESIADFFFGHKVPAEKYTGLTRRLSQAGYRTEKDLRIFWGVRIFLTAALAGGGFLLAALLHAPLSKLLVFVAIGAVMGYFLPYLHACQIAKSRTLAIKEALPDTLDLLVICIEAGVGLDAAMVRVGKEQAEQGLAVGEEIQLTTMEMQAGTPRRRALSRLADRLGLEEIRSLTALLIQTEEIGGSVARSLRIFASTSREKRSQAAEEATRKAVIKLLFPLIFFILPAILIIILGPAFINIMAVLSDPLGK